MSVIYHQSEEEFTEKSLLALQNTPYLGTQRYFGGAVFLIFRGG
jgi:hypothetical protein